MGPSIRVSSNFCLMSAFLWMVYHSPEEPAFILLLHWGGPRLPSCPRTHQTPWPPAHLTIPPLPPAFCLTLFPLTLHASTILHSAIYPFRWFDIHSKWKFGFHILHPLDYFEKHGFFKKPYYKIDLMWVNYIVTNVKM